ncbi:MAG: hypothetical protein ACRDHK_11730, partial [Actinomycetota bacterium]
MGYGGPITDTHNPYEAAHIDEPQVGTWTLSVTGAAPIGNSGVNEDANGNFRLDAGEDALASGGDADGILDVGGQPYAVACSGPVVTPAQDMLGPGSHAGTGNLLRWDAAEYNCRTEAKLNLFDATLPPPTAVAVTEAVTLIVRDGPGGSGAVVDTELVIFDAEGGGLFSSRPIQVIEDATPAFGNAVLDVENSFSVEALYPDPDHAVDGRAVAEIDCNPFFLTTDIGVAGITNRPFVVSGGCDTDSFPDPGERWTLSYAICNESNRATYTDVVATLSLDPLSPIVAAGGTIDIVDPVIELGDLRPGSGCGVPPLGSGYQIASFELSVPIGAQAIIDAAPADGVAILNITLSAASGTHRIEAASPPPFRLAIGADKETRNYSTDEPGGSGGVVTRDLNRDGVISTDVDGDNIPDILDNAIADPEESVAFDAIPRIAPSPAHTGNTC